MSSVLDVSPAMLAPRGKPGGRPRTDSQVSALRDLEAAFSRAAAVGLLESLIEAADFSDSVGDVFDTVRRLRHGPPAYAARPPAACRLRIA